MTIEGGTETNNSRGKREKEKKQGKINNGLSFCLIKIGTLYKS